MQTTDGPNLGKQCKVSRVDSLSLVIDSQDRYSLALTCLYDILIVMHYVCISNSWRDSEKYRINYVKTSINHNKVMPLI